MATSADTKPGLARPRRSAAPTALSRRIWGLADPLLDPRGCLFIFHRAAPHAEWDGLPNREFYLDLDFLDRMLTHLVASGWAIVTLDEAIERMADPGRMRRFVNFSVDDCYRDTFEHVVPLFRRHGVPVTLFVTTGIPDGTLPLWAAGLEEALRTRDSVLLPEGPLAVATPEAKREAFGRLAREWDGSQAGARYTEFCRLNGIDEADMHLRHAISWEMLEDLRDDPLVEIGGHTVSHARIAALDTEAAYGELAGCRERLRERLGCDARHFAFPYGRRGDCGPRDFELARKAGYTSSATTRKGVVRAGQEAWTLPRNTLNGAHRNLLITEAHLSGATGVAGRILGHV